MLQQRLANKYLFMAADHALRGGVGLSFTVFCPTIPVLPLGPGERRYYVNANSLLAEVLVGLPSRVRRSCIRSISDRSTRLEVFWGDPYRRILHSHTDQGSRNMPHKFYLYARRGVRGWCWIDSPHRRANNTILALKDVGLPTLKDEMALVCSVGTGPWKGGAHFGKYFEAMAEHASNFTWRDDLFPFCTTPLRAT